MKNVQINYKKNIRTFPVCLFSILQLFYVVLSLFRCSAFFWKLLHFHVGIRVTMKVRERTKEMLIQRNDLKIKNGSSYYFCHLSYSSYLLANYDNEYVLKENNFVNFLSWRCIIMVCKQSSRTKVRQSAPLN